MRNLFVNVLKTRVSLLVRFDCRVSTHYYTNTAVQIRKYTVFTPVLLESVEISLRRPGRIPLQPSRAPLIGRGQFIPKNAFSGLYEIPVSLDFFPAEPACSVAWQEPEISLIRLRSTFPLLHPPRSTPAWSWQ